MSSEPTGVLTQQFAVPFSYTVAFTHDVFAAGNPLLANTLTSREPHRRHRALLVLDDGVDRAYPHLATKIRTYFSEYAPRVALVREPLVIPGGEICKNDPAVLAGLLDQLSATHMDRHAFVVALGGGAVLDVAGYAAAITHRGVRTVRLPSTVLGQNDSGVGVKNGVNAFGAKNYLGTFAPPFAVINDFDLLERLPARERIAGYAEAVKVALIRDERFFTWLEENAQALAEGKAEPLAKLVRRAAELHLRHIATGGDPFEQGSARPLDFGHWAAHKLETLTHHQLRHGEAVALGMLLDARHSVLTGRLSEADFERVAQLISALGLPTWHQALALREPRGALAILAGLEEFREHLGGDLTVTLLARLGRGEETHEMAPMLVERSVADLEAWNQRRAAAHGKPLLPRSSAG